MVVSFFVIAVGVSTVAREHTNTAYLEDAAPQNSTNNACEFQILIKYDPDSMTVFKILEAEIPD